MTLRVAVYGRHSSNKQNPTSSRDQAAACGRVVDYLGGEVVEVYLDPEISGYRRDRPGLQRLLRDVRDGLVDVVVCEALDRIARDAEDVAWLGKKLKFSRVRLHTVAENEIDDIKLAVASMLGAIFISQLQQKVLRGMHAAVLAGRFAGGRAYGYSRVVRLDARGEPVRGLLEIDESRAEVVRRIHREFASGRSARDIAKRLNAEGVPSPRDGEWNQSTIRGDPRKHVGILNNPLYRGQLVWGRREWRKDPDSERRERRYRLRDESEWTRVAVPDLRIVDDDLVAKVDAELARRRLPAGARSAAGSRRNRHLLSGLIRCGVCGANYVVGSADYYRCASVKERGTCGNRVTVRISTIEDVALSTLQSELLTEEHVDLFAAEFAKELARLSREESALDDRQQARLSTLNEEIGNLAANMLTGVLSPTLARMLADREAERERLIAERSRTIPSTHPMPSAANLRGIFERRVADLRSSLSDRESRPEAGGVLAGLLREIIIHPNAAGASPEAEITAELSRLIDFAANDRRPRRANQRGQSAITVVAGVGFEPTTFRL